MDSYVSFDSFLVGMSFDVALVFALVLIGNVSYHKLDIHPYRGTANFFSVQVGRYPVALKLIAFY